MNLYAFEILWVLVLEIKGFPTKYSVFRRGRVKKAFPQVPDTRERGEGGAEARQRKGESRRARDFIAVGGSKKSEEKAK